MFIRLKFCDEWMLLMSLPIVRNIFIIFLTLNYNKYKRPWQSKDGKTYQLLQKNSDYLNSCLMNTDCKEKPCKQNICKIAKAMQLFLCNVLITDFISP